MDHSHVTQLIHQAGRSPQKVITQHLKFIGPCYKTLSKEGVRGPQKYKTSVTEQENDLK